MPELFDIGAMDMDDMAFMEIAQFDNTRLDFTEPDDSYWTKKNLGKNRQMVVRARILRTDKDMGTINVVGIDSDINIEIPITNFFAGTEFYGDVSLPAAGWEVILLCSENGDYYPIAYKRPYSETDAWMLNYPDEIEPGDYGLVSKGGGKFLFLESGLIQLESSPACVRIMSPLEDDERIDDICRRYGLHSDAGTMTFQEYENSPTQASRMEMKVGSKMMSTTDPLMTMVAGSFDAAEANGGLKMQVTDPTTKAEKSSFEFNKLGISRIGAATSAHINAPKVTLGGEAATEPVVHGNKLSARISAIESTLNGLALFAATHTHVIFTLAPPAAPVPDPTKLAGPTAAVITHSPLPAFNSTVSFST